MVFEYENSSFKRLISEQRFRDLSQFYHLVIAVDTAIASPSSDKVKVYLNGERITVRSGYEQYQLKIWNSVNEVERLFTLDVRLAKEVVLFNRVMDMQVIFI